jgi:predicted nuclease of restriction endonuclease-like (RecB) superfamily
LNDKEKRLLILKLRYQIQCRDLAQQTLKDPCNFDFVAMTSKMKERDLEKHLVTQISSFLLELGKGFAFMGQQFIWK